MTSPSPERGPISADDAVAQAEASVDRHRKLSPFWWTILLTAALLSIALSIYVIFGLGNRLGTYVPLETEYFYAMLGLLLPLVFLLYQPWKGVGPMERVPWYDILLALVTVGISIYFVLHGNQILLDGWEYVPITSDSLVLFGYELMPEKLPAYFAFIMWAIVLEAARRAGGLPIFFICVLLSIYPVYANYFPGVFEGQPTSWEVAAGFHIFGTESVLGIPMKAFANLVVGFLVFGVALQFTGGGSFFLNLAFAMLGKFRGGPAKVAIFASGLMGSMSGSVITNVLTTGVMTIPAMKRVGFRASYAGGVEACASTGGVLMPPIMGATAFVMATYLEIPYGDIVLAAIIPSVLYYFGLFVQIDAYSARFGLKGLPVSELPRVLTVMKEGWYFIFVFALLIYMLIHMQREAQAPYYATALLLLINQVSPRHRWNLRKLMDFLVGIGGDSGRYRADHRCAHPLRQDRLDCLRVGERRRGRRHYAADSGRAHQFRAGHRYDGDSGLSVPGGDGVASPGPRRFERIGRAPVPALLGHDQLHHAAGRHRRLCRRERCGIEPDPNRL